MASQKETNKTWPWFTTGLLLLTVFFLSGAVTFFMNIFFLKEARDVVTPLLVVSEPPASAVSARIAQPELRDRTSVLTSVVSIYKKKKGVAENAVIRNIYAPEERLGGAFILTSDGWLATASEVFSDKDSAVVEISHRMYDVEKKIDDPVSGVSFLKISTSNASIGQAGLPVSRFGSGASLEAGEAVFVATDRGEIVPAFVESPDALNAESASDFVFSTEHFSKIIRFAFSGNAVSRGSPLLNAKGEVVGVLARGEKEAYALPIENFRGILGTVFKDGKVVRPFFGAHYIDLARVVGFREEVDGTFGLGPINVRELKGAYVYNGDPSAAIVRNSPASRAKIQFGDLIRKIEGVDIDVKRNLTDVLQEYHPGDTVLVTLERGGKTIETSVVLGEMK